MGTGRSRTVSELEQHVGYWLRFVSNHVSHSFMRKMESHGVTVAEWAVMRQMLQAGRVNPSHLAEGMGMTRGAISKLIERLCEKHLVERTTSQTDRRYQTVSLTNKGKSLVPRLARLADQNDQQYFGHLSDEQKNQLVALLQDIVRRQNWKDVPVN